MSTAVSTRTRKLVPMGNYFLAQYGEFKYSIRNQSGRAVTSFEAEMVQQLSSKLLVVQRRYHKKLSLFSVEVQNFISLPIYESFSIYGRYIIFSRDGKFGVGAVGTSFFELEAPSFDKILFICDGNVFYQNSDTYGIKNIFAKKCFESIFPFTVDQRGTFYVVTPDGIMDIRTYFDIGNLAEISGQFRNTKNIANGVVSQLFIPDNNVDLYAMTLGRDKGTVAGYGYLLTEGNLHRQFVPFENDDANCVQNFISFYNKERNETSLFYAPLAIEVLHVKGRKDFNMDIEDLLIDITMNY